ncbi:MAG: type II secretion system F family protein [Pseudomonadota bacterium]
MDNSQYALFIISFLVFISLALTITGIFIFVNYQRKRQNLIKRVTDRSRDIRKELSKDKPSGYDSIKNVFIKIISSFGKFTNPKNEIDISYMRRNLFIAGFRRENAHIIFLGIKSFLALLFFLVIPLLKISGLKTFALSPTNILFYAVVLALIGFYSPSILLRSIIARRKKKILEGFPDALDLLVVCVESGLGLDAAITRVGMELELTNKELGEEFKLLNMELRAGKPRQSALKSLAARTELDEVSSLVTILIQTDKFGTSVAKALRIHSDYMRITRFQRAEEIAAKLPVKLLFPLILFIFPSLFVVILGPVVIQIMRVLLPAMAG